MELVKRNNNDTFYKPEDDLKIKLFSDSKKILERIGYKAEIINSRVSEYTKDIDKFTTLTITLHRRYMRKLGTFDLYKLEFMLELNVDYLQYPGACDDYDFEDEYEWGNRPYRIISILLDDLNEDTMLNAEKELLDKYKKGEYDEMVDDPY